MMTQRLDTSTKIYLMAVGFIFFGIIIVFLPIERLIDVQPTTGFVLSIFGIVFIMIGLFIAIIGIYAER